MSVGQCVSVLIAIEFFIDIINGSRLTPSSMSSGFVKVIVVVVRVSNIIDILVLSVIDHDSAAEVSGKSTSRMW